MIRTVVLGMLVGLGAFWSWFYYDRTTAGERELEARQQRIDQLESVVGGQKKTIHEQGEEIDRLDLARQLLQMDHRVARVRVISQVPDPDNPDSVITTVQFDELGVDGEPIGEPGEYSIPGKRLYFDGMVIKFDDSYVELGDELRGTSICLFERIFSDKLSPEDGIELRARNLHPLPHSGDDPPNPLYDKLFEKAWDYANNPAQAAKLGVRAIQGEAPSIEARPGKVYRLELRRSGGMTITAEE